METLFEDLVTWKITRDPLVFVNRQYNMGGWSCPDIVALNYRNKQIWVVEVSTAADAKDLARKVKDRDKQWFGKLRDLLGGPSSTVIDASWSFVIKAFIRQDAVQGFQRILGEPLPKDVEVEILDNIRFPWQWELNSSSSSF